MTRNLNRRVEIACPVHDAFLREQLQWILDSQLHDTAKASILLPDGSYCRKHRAVPFDSQDYFMQQSPHIPAQPRTETLKLIQRMMNRSLTFFAARRSWSGRGTSSMVLSLSFSVLPVAPCLRLPAERMCRILLQVF